MRTLAAIIALLVCGLLTGPAQAADGGWKFELTPYIWGVGIDGDVTVGGTEVDTGFDDLIDNIGFGGNF